MADVFDHVTIGVSDLEASRRFYELAHAELGHGEPYRDESFLEWEDLSIAAAGEDRQVTRNLHLALLARSGHDEVDAWWEAMTAAGYPDDGAPGPRLQYSPGYYGAFVRDPDGNSVEAVHHGELRGGDNRLDHLWIRVRDLDASRRFYETVAPVVGLGVHDGAENRFHVAGEERSFALVREDPVTENVHLAFPALDRAGVEEFHRAAVGAGFRDNGGPGERSYHSGYYGAYVLDPDGNNIEAVFHDRPRTVAIVLRGGAEVDDPLALALGFLEAYPGYDGPDPSAPSSFGEADLRHANRGGARISAAEIAAILERRGVIERALRAIPTDASLAAAEGSMPWVPLRRLFDAFAELHGVGFSKMTKSLHRKRPALIPLLDSVVQAYLEEDDPGAQSPFGERAVALVRGYKRDLDHNRLPLRATRRELAARGHHITEVRLLDVLIWSASAAS